MLTIEALNAHYGASHILHGVDLFCPRGRSPRARPQRGWQDDDRARGHGLSAADERARAAGAAVEITGWTTHRIARAGVAYVPEGRQIFPDLSVVENIRVAERRPAKSGLSPVCSGSSLRCGSEAANKGAQLSGGEQQMLAIARALVSDPKVLLLDEPSQGLAPLVVRELTEVIRRLRDDGVTILLIEQNVEARRGGRRRDQYHGQGPHRLHRYPGAIPMRRGHAP